MPSTAAAFGWHRIAVVENATNVVGDWRTIAGSTFGYAFVASSPPAVWFSPDGVSWSATRLTVPEGHAIEAKAIAGGEDGIVVVGKYTPCSRRAFERNPYFECRGRPVSWASRDGRSWTASPSWSRPLGEPGRSGGLFYQVWAVPGVGWDAAVALDPSDESDDFDLEGPAVWHSSDGLDWKLLKAQASGECGTDLEMSELRAGADAAGRRVAVGEPECFGTPAIWSSADGRAWSPVAAFATEWPTATVLVVLPTIDARPWRLLGWASDSNVDPMGATVWKSTDLVTWTMDPLPSGRASHGIVLAATQGTELDVAVGRGGGGNLTWTSDDGVAWQLTQSSSPAIEVVASGPAGVLGLIGTWHDAGEIVTGFEVWQLVPDSL